jgi:hypothetical protein
MPELAERARDALQFELVKCHYGRGGRIRTTPAERTVNAPGISTPCSSITCATASALPVEGSPGKRTRRMPNATRAQAEHEFAEILIGGHGDALVGVGKLKHGLVGDARREFGNVDDVVAVGPQPGDDG